MDLRRYALYTALAIITYLMLLAWQEDYPPLVDDGGAPALDTEDAGAPAASDVPADLPTLATERPSAVPGLPDPAEPPATQAGDSIRVTTDTFEIEIDLTGGDIVHLALPRYLKQLDVPDDPFVVLESSPGRNYIAQSGLIGADGIDNEGRPTYRASDTAFRLEPGQDRLEVDLFTEGGDGVQVIKRYGFSRDSYLIDISFLVDNQSDRNWQANAYGQIRRDSFDDPSNVLSFGATYLGFVSTSVDDPYIKTDFDDIDDGARSLDLTGGWVGFSQHYFLSAWIPDANTANRITTRRSNTGQYVGEFTSAAFSAGPGATGTHRFGFYAGPKDQYTLAEIAPNLDLTIDYGFLWFLAAPIYWLLTRINSLIGNYGVSIILLTVIVKAFFYKLSETQYRSMAAMRRVMPKMQQLKDSYGDDRARLQKATMELYKKEKINPFGGCLPVLVQMPVFIALYWVLLESVELRHAPFVLYLTDLSVRDPFFILPLLMGGTMYLQTLLSPAPNDPMQARVMKLMPIMMTVLFLWFPAGLVLYWLTNGVLGILQQWYITRKIEATYEAKKAG